jgi:ATP-dependent exoDNAse (exonuclease V) alpha subunit
MVNPGEPVEFYGDFEVHPRFGRRFKVTDFRFVDPTSLDMIRKYLASGFIKEVGPVTADRIVNHIREQTFEVMDKAPRRLLEVKGSATKSRSPNPGTASARSARSWSSCRSTASRWQRHASHRLRPAGIGSSAKLPPHPRHPRHQLPHRRRHNAGMATPTARARSIS